LCPRPATLAGVPLRLARPQRQHGAMRAVTWIFSVGLRAGRAELLRLPGRPARLCSVETGRVGRLSLGMNLVLGAMHDEFSHVAYSLAVADSAPAVLAALHVELCLILHLIEDPSGVAGGSIEVGVPVCYHRVR
jgi:hypothetical protein